MFTIKVPSVISAPMEFTLESDVGNVTLEVMDEAYNYVFDVVSDYRLEKLGKLASEKGVLYIKQLNLKGLSLTDAGLQRYMTYLIETTLLRLKDETGVPVIIHSSIRIEDSMPSEQYERECKILRDLYELAGCIKLDGRDHVTYLVHNYKEPTSTRFAQSNIFR